MLAAGPGAPIMRHVAAARPLGGVRSSAAGGSPPIAIGTPHCPAVAVRGGENNRAVAASSRQLKYTPGVVWGSVPHERGLEGSRPTHHGHNGVRPTAPGKHRRCPNINAPVPAGAGWCGTTTDRGCGATTDPGHKTDRRAPRWPPLRPLSPLRMQRPTTLPRNRWTRSFR